MNTEFYPLTGPQMNMWMLEQVNSNCRNLTTIFTVLKLPQTTNLKLLDKTLNKIREVNDSLRLRFVVSNDSSGVQEIQQYIEPYEYRPSRIIYHDFEEVLSVIENEKDDHLSVDGKVNELAIIKTPFNCFVLYKSHHIASDGWGMTQVADQIKEIYCRFENGEDLTDYKKPSYIDFINREQEYIRSSRYARDIDFWAKTVKEIEPCTFFKNINNFDKSAKRFEKEISQGVCKKIEDFCSENKITEYSFFLAIISIYFNSTYNINNFAIGTPFLNRQKRYGEFEETGLHISTLPLPICIDENEDFVELCKKINSKNLGLYKHGSFPYYNIQKLFDDEKKISSNLYEIAFSYQINVSEREFSSKCYDKTIKNHWNKGIGECTWFFSGEQNNAITFHLTQLNVKKLFAIDYLTSIFNESDIENIYDSIFYLIEQVIDFEKIDNNKNIESTNTNINKSLKISDFQLINHTQIQQLQKFNHTGNMSNIDKTVIDYLEEVVQRHPRKTALICNNLKMNYSDFYEKINTLADVLIDNGVYPNSPIVLLFDKSFDMLISIFATLKIGCYYVPILPDENPDRVTYILNDCKPSIILTHKNYDNLIKNTGLKYLNLNDIFSEAELVLNMNETDINQNNNIINTDNSNFNNNSDNDFNNTFSISIKDKSINPSNIAYIIYTSGSTGNPKGVQVMHKNIISLIESMKQDNILKPNFSDVSMSLLKYSFDASGIDIYSSLLTRWYTSTCWKK